MDTPPTLNVKQVIVVRTDLKVRKGKYVNQGCHGSNSFMRLRNAGKITESFTPAQKVWMASDEHPVIVCAADDEQHLLDIMSDAQLIGLEVHLVTDFGFTEFNGVKTKTAIAIGPDYVDKIDSITGHLKLL